MRNILFRGKKINGEWVEGYYIKDGLKSLILNIDERPRSIIEAPPPFIKTLVRGATVGQFTGRIDNYGERKWEGDIFKFGDHVYIIEWDEDELAFRAFEPFEPDYTTDLAEFSADEIEVIGNIHDNPELIAEGDAEI